MDSEDRPVGELYGRCDREQKCGYYRYPDSDAKVSDTAVSYRELEKPVLEFSPLIKQFGEPFYSSNLCNYALSTLSKGNEERVRDVFKAYNVRYYKGYTLFFQIDCYGQVRSGKLIRYGNDGHRSHDEHSTTWLHVLPETKPYHNGGRLHQCFFGEHLLDANNYKAFFGKGLRKDTPVFMVESEKTALLMSVHSKADGIWMACGGSQMLVNRERLRVLQGRKVTLIPDQGQYWNWHRTADENGWEIVSSIDNFDTKGYESVVPFEKKGCDVWDIWEWVIKVCEKR